MRRSVASVALNIAEGSGSQGRKVRSHYFIAMGSARETVAALEVAHAMNLAPVDELALRKLDNVIAVLYRRCHK